MTILFHSIQCLMRSARLPLLLLLLGSAVLAQAQTPVNDASRAYNNQPLGTTTPFQQGDWEQQTKGLKYTVRAQSEVISLEQNNTVNPPPRQVRGETDGRTVARMLLFLLGVLVVVFVIYRLVGGNAVLTNRNIQRRPVRLEDIEKNLQEADVESFLDKAIREQKYRLAIRLYYLAIIKKLAEKGYIHWKKEKTNGQYLRELRKKKNAQAKAFREVTRVFERVWYSTMPFDGNQFKEVRLGFNELLNNIK